MSILTGAKLVGDNPERGRAVNDYYATPFNATEAILKEIPMHDFTILEPAAGEGHIVKVIKELYPYNEITANDLIDRNSRLGIKINENINFLTYNPNCKYDVVITNPPFSLAQPFIEKALTLANNYVIIFAKIQLLEGKERQKMFKNSPLKYIYVFSKRVNPLRNGEEYDENGKPWASTMCFAWYVWEIGYKGEPIVRWI